MKIKILEKYSNMPRRAKASLWFLFSSFMQKGISMITTPIFTRLLSSAEYGQFSVYNSWLNILSVFVTFRLTYDVYIQGLVKFEHDKKVFSSSLQGLNLSLCSLCTVIYLLFHNFFNHIFGLTTVQMLLMFLTIWTTEVFGFWAVEKRVDLGYKQLVCMTVLFSLAKPIVGIFLVYYAEDKVTARIFGIALVEIVLFFGLFVQQMRKGKTFYSHKYWKYAILYNAPIIPHYLSQIVLNSSDRIMIAKMVSDESAGIYSVAYSVAGLMSLFKSALSQTYGPWIYQKIKAKKITDIATALYGGIAIFAILNLILIAFAPELVKLFAPPKYYEAIWIIPPVTMGMFFGFSYEMFSKFAFYFEKTKFVMYGTIISAVSNLILNYIFIRIFGYIAAGYTTLICFMLYAIAHYVFMNKICDEYLDGVRPFNLKILCAISGVFIVIGTIFLVTYNNIFIRYSLVGIIVIIAILMRKSIMEPIRLILKNKRRM